MHNILFNYSFYYSLEFDDKGKVWCMSCLSTGHLHLNGPWNLKEVQQSFLASQNHPLPHLNTNRFRISVVVIVLMLRLLCMCCAFNSSHLTQQFPTSPSISGAVSTDRMRCVWKAEVSLVYQISGPWEERHWAPLWPLQRVPPHEEIWGHSTHPPPHCWTSSGRSVRMEKSSEQSEQFETRQWKKHRGQHSLSYLFDSKFEACVDILSTVYFTIGAFLDKLWEDILPPFLVFRVHRLNFLTEDRNKLVW